MPKNNKEIEDSIKDKFAEMLAKSETSPELKEEVFNTIGRIENAALLFDLFTFKMARTTGSIIENMSNSPDKKEE